MNGSGGTAVYERECIFMFGRSSGGLVLCNSAPKNNNDFFFYQVLMSRELRKFTNEMSAQMQKPDGICHSRQSVINCYDDQQRIRQ